MMPFAHSVFADHRTIVGQVFGIFKLEILIYLLFTSEQIEPPLVLKVHSFYFKSPQTVVFSET